MSQCGAANHGSDTALRELLFLALAGLAAGLLAVSHQSFWIDEALTGTKAQQHTLAGWWHVMKEESGSDLQMPLYMIYAWVVGNVFGTGEWMLRAANIPWFIAGFVAFVCSFPPGRRVIPALVTACSPFAWYYIGEARPYAMQIGSSLLVFAALRRIGKGASSAEPENEWWMAGFLCGLIALAGSSLLGAIWTAAAVAGVPVILGFRNAAALARRHWIGCAMTAIALAALAGYYCWTLTAGARASAIGATDIKNLAFVVYELLGADGLGPGRLEIRAEGLAAFKPHIFGLAVYGALALALLAAGWKPVVGSLSGKTRAGVILLIAGAAGFILSAGWIMHFRVLGRHLAPALPVVLLFLSEGLRRCFESRNAAGKLTGIFLALSLVSCLSLRFAKRHERDDYRAAASLASKALAEGKTVWWSAGKEGADYYQLPETDAVEDTGKALLVVNSSREALAKLPRPALVIVSRPDVYDGGGTLAGYLEGGKFIQGETFTAFTVWHAPVQ